MACDRCGDSEYLALIDFELPHRQKPAEFGIQQNPPHAKLCADCINAVAREIWDDEE